MKHPSLDKMLEINIGRNAMLDAEYNPITGVGSLIERKLLTYSSRGRDYSFNAPVPMFDEPVIQDIVKHGSLENVIEKYNELIKKNPEAGTEVPLSDAAIIQFEKELIELRIKHDFEFHCATNIKVPNYDSEDMVPFILNLPQRQLVKEFEEQRLAEIPIREIIDKARQWGGSTVTQIYMNWIQLYHRERWNMAICTAVNTQAGHIRNMFERTINNYPAMLGKFTIKNYQGFDNVKLIPERDCQIAIGSSEKPDTLRTFNIFMAHLSEVSTWGSTLKKSASALVQSLRGSVKDVPYSMIVLESTAKGIGNLFHKEWMNAIKKKSGYRAFFVPWFNIPMYRRKIEDYEAFYKTLNSAYLSDGTELWFLWECGATLEGINWYIHKKTSENMDDVTMMQEFPSTWEESFIASGRPAFNPLHIKSAEKNCRDPQFKGILTADSTTGKGSFNNIIFTGQPEGDLWIWEMPDIKTKVSNRYCGFMDIGGKHSKADWTIIKIFDRYWMIDGGVPEVVAVWRGHLDFDLAAWKAAQLCYWYNRALLAIETNFIDNKGEFYEGEHSMTIMNEIGDTYPNLYARSRPDKVSPEKPLVWGYHTNKATKPLLVDTLNKGLRDELYIERDIRACEEMYSFELKDNGKYGAKEGTHDDQVIVTAGGLWLALDYMPKPVEIIENTTRKTGRRVVGEASL